MKITRSHGACSLVIASRENAYRKQDWFLAGLALGLVTLVRASVVLPSSRRWFGLPFGVHKVMCGSGYKRV